MEYAVIEANGKQYKVIRGLVFETDNVDAKEGDNIPFDKILLYVSNGAVRIGSPYIDNIKVVGKVLHTQKGPKVDVLKFRAKSRHRRASGYRGKLTKIEVIDILDHSDNEKKEVKFPTKSKKLTKKSKL